MIEKCNYYIYFIIVSILLLLKDYGKKHAIIPDTRKMVRKIIIITFLTF